MMEMFDESNIKNLKIINYINIGALNRCQGNTKTALVNKLRIRH